MMSGPSAPSRPRATRPSPGRRLLFLGVSFALAAALAFGVLELALRLRAGGGHGPPDGRSAATLPPGWAREEVEVPGAVRAYRWHGHLHLLNRDEMRTTGLYPPKPEGRFRILVVGDSLTYGVGVAAEQAYPSLLDAALGPRVEVLNLGVSGAQSEEIAETVRQQFEEAQCVRVRGLGPELAALGEAPKGRMCQRFGLDPDLIVYGVCLNDLLPSGMGEQARTEGWQVPFPGKAWLMERSLAARLLAERYEVALVKLGLRRDFFEEVKAGGREYVERFADDVRRMNEVVTRHGRPPVVAMVLQQYMGDSPELVAAAEDAMRRAGMVVVDAAYIERNAGRRLDVSRWEAHPNAEAHRIYADELGAALREHPALLAFLDADAAEP